MISMMNIVVECFENIANYWKANCFCVFTVIFFLYCLLFAFREAVMLIIVSVPLSLIKIGLKSSAQPWLVSRTVSLSPGLFDSIPIESRRRTSLPTQRLAYTFLFCLCECIGCSWLSTTPPFSNSSTEKPTFLCLLGRLVMQSRFIICETEVRFPTENNFTRVLLSALPTQDKKYEDWR